MNIVCEASDKFKPFQDEVCGTLLEMLLELAALEKEIFERNEEYDRQKIKNGIPKHQIYPEFPNLVAEFKTRYKGIVETRCTEKLFKRGYAGSFGSPQKYGYLNGDCTVNFKMRSADKATVETHYHKGIDCKHKFTLICADGRWLLDAVHYGFENNKTWHIDNI